MNSAIYDLPIKNNAMRWAATAWLTLGLASLVAAGFYSILLVLARTPIVQEMISLVDFFRRFTLTPRMTLLFLLIMALPVITVPFLYVAHEIVSPGHRLAFTELMKYGGLSCVPLGFAVLFSLWNSEKPEGEGRYLGSALQSSILLFALGGALGFAIAGLDIVIPAHYHGSTVGVTIAFMGLTYYLLPRLGFGPLPPRMAFWQPYIYGGGQLMHIIGLAWSGGYSVQRKTAGLTQGVERSFRSKERP